MEWNHSASEKVNVPGFSKITVYNLYSEVTGYARVVRIMASFRQVRFAAVTVCVRVSTENVRLSSSVGPC